MDRILVTLAHTAAATPSPAPTPVDENLVTPGVVGFLVTGLFFLAIVLLAVDLGRRIRRVRYREQARQKIAAELDEQLADADAADSGRTEPDAADPDDTPRGPAAAE